MNVLASSASRRAGAWDFIPELAAEQLPRYTSYPPANRFSDAIDAASARAARRALPRNSSLSLYLHIPFCKKLCWYCGCHTSVPTAADPVEAYLEALLSEIRIVAKDFSPGTRVSRIHFGGGSPDILTPKQISAIFAALRQHFDIAQFADIAVELDPRGVTQGVADAYCAEGVTRASLGAQVLSLRVQEKINRIQPAALVEAVIARLRKAGVLGINLDLMYGLPAQTLQDVIETAAFAATQDVDRVAVFGYAHVPWMKKHQKGIDAADLPLAEERFRQAEAAARALETGGYIPVGFDHFAAPGDSLLAADLMGRLRRNFQGYTDDDSDALIGLGASAISSLPDLIYQNTPDTGRYRSALAEGDACVTRGTILTAADKRIAKAIERTLCDFDVRLDPDLERRARPALSRLESAGLVRLANGRLTVTDRGRPYVRNVAACLDPDFAAQPGKHSLAI